MKRTIQVASGLCAAVAVLTLVMGVRVLTGHGFYVGLALFSMARQGTFMGFIGNLLGIVMTCAGFGALAYFGLASARSDKARKNAFIFGALMSALCIISVICSIFARTFNFGDIIMTLLPVVYTFAVFKSA